MMFASQKDLRAPFVRVRAFGAILALACSVSTMAAPQVLTAAPRSDESRYAIAIEAQNKYDEAAGLVVADPARARELFSDSAAKFQKIVDDGVSNGELFFNFGNALVQSGSTARGIGAYLNADRILPGDSRIATNLAHARSLLPAQRRMTTTISPVDHIATYWKSFGQPVRVSSALAAWFGLWAIIAIAVMVGWQSTTRLRLWRGSMAVASVVCLGLTATIVVDAIRYRIDPPGILVSDQVIVRKGNGDGFAASFTEPLPIGEEFTMIESRPGWYRIQLADGQSGWVKHADAIVVGRVVGRVVGSLIEGATPPTSTDS